MQSALQYVKTKLPKVVIFENVLGMLCKPMGSKLRNVDIVLEKLREWGYTCDYDRQDARHWWTPPDPWEDLHLGLSPPGWLWSLL